MNTMPLGKYKGVPFADVPADYLMWLVGQDWPSDPLRAAARNEIDRRSRATSVSADTEPDVPGLPATIGPDLARALVQAGRRALAEQYPDADYPTLALALDATADMLTTWALEVFDAKPGGDRNNIP